MKKNHFLEKTNYRIVKNEINKLKKIIENQNNTITTLQNKLNNLNNLQNIIKLKEQEINKLKLELQNINSQNKIIINPGQMMAVNFISTDSKIHFAVSCFDYNTFAEVEEKLYKQFPEYRETNNDFLANGEQVLRFKTIKQNKIGDGLPVTMIIP